MKRIFVTLPMVAILAVAAAAQTNQPASAQTQTQPASQQSDVKTDADHHPLTLEQHEVFGGPLTPFARKKYVRKPFPPVGGRVNKRDDLTATNTKAIKD